MVRKPIKWTLFVSACHPRAIRLVSGDEQLMTLAQRTHFSVEVAMVAIGIPWETPKFQWMDQRDTCNVRPPFDGLWYANNELVTGAYRYMDVLENLVFPQMEPNGHVSWKMMNISSGTLFSDKPV